MNLKLAITGLLASSGKSLFASAQKTPCPTKPIPIRDIKFSDLEGDTLHNYLLVGQARIVEGAPGGIPRALRIDSTHSYALLKGIDISPSNMKDVTLAVGVYVESVKPARPGAPVPGQIDSYGWVMSHDNGGYDRAIFLHDERFGGAGMTAGYIPDAESPQVPLQEWVQIVAVWRQGGECSLFIDNEKVDFPEPVIGKNNDGLPNISIGAPQLKAYALSNDNDFWIKDVKIFDYALSDEDVDDLNCHFDETLDPTIDCGNGGEAVYSCTECVSGPGSAAGCAGDCMWRPEIPNCVEKNDSAENILDDNGVDCGNHDAAFCSDCDLANGGRCIGDCVFANNACHYSPTNPICLITAKDDVTNVALGQPASQSSNYKANTSASKVVDGEKRPESVLGLEGGVSITKPDLGPWWKVSLDSEYVITRIEIYNRSNYYNRLQGFRVEIFNGDDENAVWTYNDPTPTGQTSLLEIPLTIPDCGIVGDRVKISLPGKKMYLQLREVEVFGTKLPSDD